MVTDNHYRWDFIGLSTDTKPTPSTSSKVSDGSTFYCSDNSKLYVWYKTQWYERTAPSSGSSYTAGDGITISDDTISVDTTTIQPKLTAGSNITIEDDTISATDTTYSAFTGTDGTVAGAAGLVPAPATTDAGKFLKADGSWSAAGGGVTTLTSADYNYPVNNPSSVALWLLDAGAYDVGEAGLSVKIDINTTISEYVGSHFEVFYAGGSNPECSIIRYTPYLEVNRVRISDGQARGKYSVIDTLTSQPITASSSPLSARQGKVLNDKFGGMQLVKISQTDYDNLSTKDPNTLYIITGA